jgi:hypothetical protein
MFSERERMNYSLYIYYKVSPGREKSVRAAAQDLFKSIAAATGVEGRLSCRRDKPDTWMEVYEGIAEPDAFQTILNKELDRLRFADLLGPDSRRMTELFRPL